MSALATMTTKVSAAATTAARANSRRRRAADSAAPLTGAGRRPPEHGERDDRDEQHPADHGDQPAESHETHAGDLLERALDERAVGHLALDAVAAGPDEPDDVQQLSAAVEVGLPCR